MLKRLGLVERRSLLVERQNLRNRWNAEEFSMGERGAPTEEGPMSGSPPPTPKLSHRPAVLSPASLGGASLKPLHLLVSVARHPPRRDRRERREASAAQAQSHPEE